MIEVKPGQYFVERNPHAGASVVYVAARVTPKRVYVMQGGGREYAINRERVVFATSVQSLAQTVAEALTAAGREHKARERQAREECQAACAPFIETRREAVATSARQLEADVASVLEAARTGRPADLEAVGNFIEAANLADDKRRDERRHD